MSIKCLPIFDIPANVLTKALNPMKHYYCLGGLRLTEMLLQLPC